MKVQALLAETEHVPGKGDEVGISVNRHEPTRSTIIGNDKSQMGALCVYTQKASKIGFSTAFALSQNQFLKLFGYK